MSTMTRRSILALAHASIPIPNPVRFVATAGAEHPGTLRAPIFQVDPTWPTVPNTWVLGEVTSIAVDSRDHVWVLHRPRSIPAERRPQAAPPVLEFDTAGKLLGSWGGPADGYEWPEREH